MLLSPQIPLLQFAEQQSVLLPQLSPMGWHPPNFAHVPCPVAAFVIVQRPEQHSDAVLAKQGDNALLHTTA